MKLERSLRSIIGLIVQCCDPEEILLFGSYAREQDNLDSDLDIMVIGNFRESPRLLRREVQELLHRFPIRIDLHLMTPEEVASELRQPYGFASSALTSAVILYQKAEKRLLTPLWLV